MFNIKIVFLVILVLVVGSCEKELELNIQHKPSKLVINSILQPDSFISVHVSRSIPIMSNDTLLVVENAKISIFENDSLLENLTYKNNGFYSSKTNKPKEGKSYKIEVSANGFSSVSAKTYIPESVPKMNVDTTTNYVSEQGFKYSRFIEKVNFSDIKEVTNYYILSLSFQALNNPSTSREIYIRINSPLIEAVGDYYTGVYSSTEKNLDDIISNRDYYATGYEMVFSDIAFEGKNVSFDIEIDNIDPKNKSNVYTTKLYSISKEYYLYIKSSTQIPKTDNLLYEKSKPYTNIENGLGVFIGCSSSNWKL